MFFVFLGGFVLCAVLVFLVSFFGVQGQTFEEALEAQRNKLKEKDKKKEKKKETPADKKKRPKKAKDAKQDASDEEETVIVEPVEEKPEPVIVPSPEPAKEEVAAPKKEKKKEKKREERKREEPAAAIVEEPVVVAESVPVAAAAASVAAVEPPKEAAITDKIKETKAEKVKEKKTKAVEEEPVVAAVKKEPVAAAVPEPVAEKVAAAAVAGEAAAPVLPEPIKKTKMEIQEVSGHVEAEKKKPAAVNKEPKVKAQKAAKTDVISQVRQATLTDTEVQALIDILLLKQSGKEEAADDWIEPGGKESEAKKTARQLAELQELLQEEQNKATNLEKKLVTLRRELNEEKAARTVHKRELEEANQKRSQEVAALNANLQQVVAQLNSAMAHNLQLENSQAHYQATIAGLQAQVSSAPADQHLLQELDQLRNIRAELTQSVAGLQQKVSEQATELEQMAAGRTQLDKLAAAASQLEQQLAAKAKEAEQLAAGRKEADQQLAAKTKEAEQLAAKAKETDMELAAKKEELEKLAAAKLAVEQQLSTAGKAVESEQTATKSNLESQLAAVTAAKQQLQLELSVLKDKLSGKEVENSRLMEENERLSEQFASSVERPAAEGEEANCKVNGHHHTTTTSQEAEEKEGAQQRAWQEKIQALTAQQDTMASKQKDLESELKASREEILKLKSKNDAQVQELGEQKEASQALLGRLFPALDQQQPLASLEQAARLHIQSLEGKAAGAEEQHTEELKKLEAQIANYKTVLAQTENMLNTLQASVESAESNWEKKYQEAVSGSSATQSELEGLRAKNAALHKELEALKLAEKELCELKVQVEEERKSRQELAVRCTELQQIASLAQQQITAHKLEAQQEPLSNGSGDQE